MNTLFSDIEKTIAVINSAETVRHFDAAERMVKLLNHTWKLNSMDKVTVNTVYAEFMAEIAARREKALYNGEPVSE